MKNFLKILTISSFVILGSCSEDALDVTEDSAGNENYQARSSAWPVKDGRLFFNSEDELVTIHKQLADEKINVKEFATQFDNSGFISLNSEYSDANVEATRNYLIENNIAPELREGEALGDAYDFTEKVLPEDMLRLLLNVNGELQIANTIYKYTDVGMFHVESQDYPALKNYLKERNISETLLVPTEEAVVVSYSSRIQETARRYRIDDSVIGKARVIKDGLISVFLPFNPDPTKSSNQAKAYEAINGSPLERDPHYEEWFNSISDCAPRATVYEWIIGNLFGDHDLCIDKYENKRRVKVKSWNMDFGVFYSIGIEVKHQFKGWTGIWRGEDIGTLKGIAEAVQFEYVIDLYNVHTNVNYNSFKHNQHHYSNLGWRYSVNPQTGWVESQAFTFSTLPLVFRYDSWNSEFYGTGWPYLDDLIEDGINTAGDATNLNEWFWQGSWTGAKSLLQYVGKFDFNNPDRSVVIKYPESNRMIIQKATFDTRHNDHKISKYFDYGGGINLTMNAGSGDVSLSGGAMTGIMKPKNLKVKLIGTAATGKGWRGKKLSTF